MSLITVNTSFPGCLNSHYIHRLPFYMWVHLKVIIQKGNDTDNIVLFRDISVYVVAVGGSGCHRIQVLTQ